MPRGAAALVLLVLLASPPVAEGVVTDRAGAALGPVWVVAGEEHLVGSTVSFAGSIVVKSGGALVLDGATLVLAGGSAPCVHVDGRVCAPDLLVEPGGRLVMRNATLSGARSDPDGHARVLVTGEADVLDSHVTRTTGLVVQGSAAEARIARTRFEDATGGVHVIRDGSADVVENALEGVGIVVLDSAARVERNVVRNATIGIRVGSTLVGSRCCGGPPVVADNVVVGSRVGIYSDSKERFAITGNRVEGAENALTVTYVPAPEFPTPGTPDLVANTVVASDVAVVVRSSAVLDGEWLARAPWTVLVHGNDLSGGCRDVVVEAMPGVPVRADARGNWWGSPFGPRDEPGCAAVTGDVDVSPWLGSPP